MIFALFCLQSISIAIGTVTKVHDIETLIGRYLLNTIDQHALHATSYDYMKMVQDESHLTAQYFQSVRYIKYGFPVHTNSSLYSQTNSTNDTIYKQLNFVQSIALHYCRMNMSDVMDSSFDNILINESELHLNSSIFPVQMVESYGLIRSEICERIKLGLYQSVIDMFRDDMYLKSKERNIVQLNPNVNADSFFSRLIRNVANFISIRIHASFSLDSIAEMYLFLVKFGEFESYKKTIIHQIWQMDDSFALQSNVFSYSMYPDIDLCVYQIKHPKMHKYLINILKQQVQSTANKSFILDHDFGNVSRKFWHYVEIYQFLTKYVAANRTVKNNIVELHNMFQLLRECQTTISTSPSSTIVDCTLIAFGIYESCKDVDGHGYVLNAIKCIISNHDTYCSKFGRFVNETDYEYFNGMFSKLRNDLRQSMNEVVFYPYIDELMNDTQFVNIVNNNTDFEIDTYLQTVLSKLMALALEEYRDIEMIKKIATVFKPKINVCINCIPESKYDWRSLMIPWMDVLVFNDCMYLTKYFQLRFKCLPR